MEETLKSVLSELQMIRKIKMIELMERGYSQSKLGQALGISQATVSRMLANKKLVNVKTAKSSSDDE